MTTPIAPPGSPANSVPKGFLFLGGDCIYIIKLAEAASHIAPTLMIVNPTFRTRNNERYAVRHAATARFREEILCIPSIFRTSVAGAVSSFWNRRFQRIFKQMTEDIGGEPVVIVPYPYQNGFTKFVPAGNLVYLNFDDYSTYDPRIAEFVEAEEASLIRRSALVTCSALHQVDRFRRVHPHIADRIQHLPAGVYSEFIGPRLEHDRRSSVVGYVGGLGDRIDWRLVAETVRLCPDLQFHFVGDSGDDPPPREQWERYKSEIRKLPNVRFLPAVAQDEVHTHYKAFGVSWIPYSVENRFNIGSSPTKLFDSFAAGCPVVATDLPEHRLYPEDVTIVTNASKAGFHLRRILELPVATDLLLRTKIWERARDQTWLERMKAICSWLRSDP